MAASVVASLCTFNLEEVARLHILFMPGIPLGLMFLVRFFRTGSWRSSVGFGLSFVLQGFASHYYLISLPLFLAPFGLMLLYWYPERRRASELGKLALPVAILSLLFLPVELVYLDTFRSYRFVQALPEGTDLARYVLPPFNSLLYGWFETRAELSARTSTSSDSLPSHWRRSASYRLNAWTARTADSFDVSPCLVCSSCFSPPALTLS